MPQSVCKYTFPSRDACWRFWRLAVTMEVEVIAGMIPYYAGSPQNYIVKILKVLVQYSNQHKAPQLTIITDDTPFIRRLNTSDFTPTNTYLWDPHGISNNNTIYLEHLFQRVCEVHVELLLLSRRSPFWSRFVHHPLCDFRKLYYGIREYWHEK